MNVFLSVIVYRTLGFQCFANTEYAMIKHQYFNILLHHFNILSATASKTV